MSRRMGILALPCQPIIYEGDVFQAVLRKTGQTHRCGPFRAIRATHADVEHRAMLYAATVGETEECFNFNALTWQFNILSRKEESKS